MSGNRLFDLNSKFFIGCNYWASHAGTAMWSDWRPQQVETDLQRLSENGIEVLRVFPLWPDFQPIENMYTGRGRHAGYRFGEERLPDTEAGQAGMSVLMMERFKQLADLAQQNGLKLMVGLLTGWMSGRLFVPPALRGKDILRDPEAMRWQIRFVSYFVKELKAHPAIIAWDLGNECNEMGQVSGADEAYVWTAAIANAIKRADPERLLISGMHSLQPTGKWTMQDQGELTDILTTHPYPFWTPYMDYDPLDTMRPLVHATAESLYYGQLSGKVCFAEEMGTMGPMVCSEEKAADFARASMLTQWAHGLDGLLWWCANDQTRLQHAPYDWVACEGELGLFTEEGRVKPVLSAIAALKGHIQNLPIEELPPRQVEGVCILNSEQDHWATALGAFMLSKQAGFDIDFRFETQPLPDSPFYLLPCVTGVQGVPKQRWEQLLEKVREGATLYISSNNGYMLNFAELTGLTVVNRSRRSKDAEVEWTHSNAESPFNVKAEFRLDYRVDKAEVLARELDGNPVFTRASYGLGEVYYCSLPIELALVQQPGVSRQVENYPYWRIYQALSEKMRGLRVISLDLPFLGVTEHELHEKERVAVVINYSPESCETELQLQTGWRVAEMWYGAASSGHHMKVQGNDGVILRLIKEE